MTTPDDQFRHEPPQPPDRTPDLSSPNRFGPFPPPIQPVPVRPLDYGRPNDYYQTPRRGGLILSILGGMGAVLASIAAIAAIARLNLAGSGPDIPLIGGALVLGACLMILIHFLGWPRAFFGIIIGGLLLLILGCGSLLATCGRL